MRWNALGRLSLAVFGLVTLVSCATMFDFGTLPSSFPSKESSREGSSARNSPSGTQTVIKPDMASFQAGRIDYSQYRLRGVEPRVQNIPSEIDRLNGDPEVYLARLVNYLIDNEPDPIIRLKNIHDWIATHIAYDAQSYFSNTVPAQSWLLTLQTGRAVCQGYADLFAKMLTIAGFRNQIVTGYSRGYGYSPLAPEVIRSNHAWNAVYLADGWYLIDVTWDSGYVDGTSFHRRYSASYFLLPPKKMIYSHYPDNVGWQLLAKPVTADAFMATPRLDGDFFSFGVSNYAELKRSYTISGEAKIRLDAAGGASQTGSSTPSTSAGNETPSNIYLTAHIRDRSGKDLPGTTFVQSTARSTTILLRPDTAGTLVLEVYAAKTANARTYERIWSTELFVTSPAQIGFPRAYSSYTDDRVALLSPLESPLKVGSNVDVKIAVPGATKVALVADSSWTMLTRDSSDQNLFRGTVRVPDVETMTVVANFPGSDQYTGLVRYTVR